MHEAFLFASSGCDGAHVVPSLFATALRDSGRGDVRILDELSSGGGSGARARRVGVVLISAGMLALVSVLCFAMWERGRTTSHLDEDVDMVAVGAPVVAGVRETVTSAEQEYSPLMQEIRAPAATIVEMATQEVDRPVRAFRRTEGTGGIRSAREAVRGARTPRRHGGTVRELAARSPSHGENGARADTGHAVPQVRRHSAMTKNSLEPVDADVQVIEAIVTRSR